MNIILFLNKDLEANLAYNILKHELLHHNLKVYYSDSVGNQEKKPADLLTLEYFEKQIFYQSLPDIIAKHEIKTSFEFFGDSFKSAPMVECMSVNAPEFIGEIKDFQPDLFISIRFGKIFKDEIIGIPKKGVLNLHSGILPDYRGILGTLHTLKDGRDKVGCTLHYISDSKIDTGSIIDTAEIEVNPEKSLFWHIINLYPPGCERILKIVKRIANKDILPVKPQSFNEGKYFSVPTESDFIKVKELGFDIVSRGDYADFLSKWVSNDLGKVLLSDEKYLEMVRLKLKNSP